MRARSIVGAIGGVVGGVLVALALRHGSVVQKRATGHVAVTSASESRQAIAGNPPRFAVAAPPKIELRPGAPGYNPSRFLALMPARDVFEQEPRRESWAKPIENWFTETVAKDFANIKSLRNLRVECRTSSCRFQWEDAGDDNRRIARLIRVLYNVGGGGAEKHEVTLMLQGAGLVAGISPDDPQGAIAAVKARRDEQIRAVTQAKPEVIARLYPELAPADWPKE
jgi:hypothetical protein